MDKQIEAFKRVMRRAERAVAQSGLSPHRMTNHQLQEILINAKVMNGDGQFLDEDSNVVNFV
jgi:hypothetical protein